MTDSDGRISTHFTLAEMTRSDLALRRGIDNTAPVSAVQELRRLCSMLLEPAREILGTPLNITSGYRSPELNEAVGGAATSAHLSGRAADVIPMGLSLTTAFEVLRKSTLRYDQIIIECNAWIHLAIAAADVAPRRQALTASGGPGHWTYTAVA